MTYSCHEIGIEDIPVRQNLLHNAIEDIINNTISGKNFRKNIENAKNSKKHYESELKELLSREGKPFEYKVQLEFAKSQLKEYTELMKAELEAKKAKYAEMDATIETTDNIVEVEEEEEGDEVLYLILVRGCGWIEYALQGV